jgi:hypothetical protein
VTDRTASSGDRLSHDAAQCRRVAGRVIAAVAERAGFVVVTGAPPSCRRAFVGALADAAAGRFQLVEIARAGGSHLDGRAVAGSAAAPPLFVIDDTAQTSAGVREICDTAPLSDEWAAMLSVRAVLIARFSLADLEFLAPRIIVAIPFTEANPHPCDTGAAETAAAPAAPRFSGPVRGGSATGPARPRLRPTGGAAAAPRPPPPRRDLRLYALLAYLAAVGVLAGSYLALQIAPPASVTAGHSGGPAAAAAAPSPRAAK